MTLNTMELKQLIQVVGQVSVPIASQKAALLGGLINKMSLMINELTKQGEAEMPDDQDPLQPVKPVKPAKPKKLKKTT